MPILYTRGSIHGSVYCTTAAEFVAGFRELVEGKGRWAGRRGEHMGKQQGRSSERIEQQAKGAGKASSTGMQMECRRAAQNLSACCVALSHSSTRNSS